MKKSSNFLDRMIERMDQLDSSSIQNYILKLVRENGSLETIFNTLLEEYDVEEEELLSDLSDLVGEIEKLGLVKLETRA